MKNLFTATIVIVMAITAVSCGLLPTDNDEPQGPSRSLFFKYTLIPESMTDEIAMAQILDPRDGYIRVNFTQVIFPVIDSLPDGPLFTMRAINRIALTPPGTGGSGRAELLGGQNPAVHPYVSGVPSSISLNVTGGSTVGTAQHIGDWQINFADGAGTIVTTGSSSQGHFMEYILNSYDATTFYATGRFACITRDASNPPRRWAIFDGEFALTKGI